MKIIAVCGMGIGTAVLLKMNAERALASTGMDGVIEVAALDAVANAARGADVLLVSADCADRLQNPPADVVVVDDVLDVSEIAGKLASLKH